MCASACRVAGDRPASLSPVDRVREEAGRDERRGKPKTHNFFHFSPARVGKVRARRVGPDTHASRVPLVCVPPPRPVPHTQAESRDNEKSCSPPNRSEPFFFFMVARRAPALPALLLLLCAGLAAARYGTEEKGKVDAMPWSPWQGRALDRARTRDEPRRHTIEKKTGRRARERALDLDLAPPAHPRPLSSLSLPLPPRVSAATFTTSWASPAARRTPRLSGPTASWPCNTTRTR